MSGSTFIKQIVEFVNELIASLDSGVLFFGSPWDFVRYLLDIILVTFLFYWILLFVRQTRAWQLIKGIVFILLFVAVCGLIGLDMVGYIFNKFLYVFAILFIVLFQPELRRVLETVGLRSESSVKMFGSIKRSEDDDHVKLSTFINEICLACKEMSRSYTGALILIERNTRLDELLVQENVVKLDAAVTSTMLQSIFYKGSPMHDGGLLIRDGRIVAARCHVPLSVTMHSLERTGTRHRAAVGASEMGDTVVVVVSEERGKTSIAVNGRLFEMSNAKELEANLAYLLGLDRSGKDARGLVKVFGKIKRRSHRRYKDSGAMAEDSGTGAATLTQTAGSVAEEITIKTRETDKTSNAMRVSASTRLLFIMVSLLLSLTLWLYIQINNNPVISKTITVPITYSTENMPANIEVSYPVTSVEFEVIGREDVITNLTSSDVVAAIDYSAISKDETGVVELPVNVRSAGANVYFRVERQVPETVSVTIYSVS